MKRLKNLLIETDFRKKLWPALSIFSLWVCLSLMLFIFIEYKFSFITTYVSILLSLALTNLFLFLKLTDFERPLLFWWRNLPYRIHQGIVGICLFWIMALCYMALFPLVKKDYEKSK